MFEIVSDNRRSTQLLNLTVSAGGIDNRQVKVSSLKKEPINPFIDAKFGNLNFHFKNLAN